jgi:RIO kinase 1
VVFLRVVPRAGPRGHWAIFPVAFLFVPAGTKGNPLSQTIDHPESMTSVPEAGPDTDKLENAEQYAYAEYEELYETALSFDITPKKKRRRAVSRRRRAEIVAGLGGVKSDAEVVFTFKAARFEEEWLIAYLKVFYDDQMITDVLREVKGGKEANVYCCRAHPRTGHDLLAVKVYRPRKLRNLRNDSQYRAGRSVLDDQGKRVSARREQRATDKKTSFGKELLHGSWIGHEFQNLARLHAAGADVPQPIAQSDNAILMEYLGDESTAAPTLSESHLLPEEARPLFKQLMHNVGLMLENDRIHGDLSAYNVLYWDGAIKIIDFPQAVDPWINPDAYALFKRDVLRVCQYFSRYGIVSDAVTLARELWAEHTRRPAD